MGELGTSEVIVKLDFLVTAAVVDQVDGFGCRSGSEERESGCVERDGDGEVA